MAKELKPGDKVAWNTSQVRTRGELVKEQTSKAKIKGHEVMASEGDPQFIVRSDKTGAKAAHKPEALKKL